MKLTFKNLLPGTLFLLLLFSAASVSCQDETVQTEAGAIKVHDLVGGLDHPWGMDFLPDGRILVTERAGTLRIFDPQDSSLSNPLQGTPEVFSKGQGGMLDVQIDPEFDSNQRVYLSFAEPGEGGKASTALGYGTLNNNRIEDFTVIFSQEPKIDGPNHFGGRIVFSDDNHVFLTLGERFQFEPAQDLSNHLGTIVRIGKDGSIPSDNPFVGQANAADEIWSYGHRNIEAAAIDPATGNLWEVEMGPMGGDEFNLVKKGENYGWPVESWGDNYDGTPIPDPEPGSKFTDAKIHWTPVISPSGMIFYDGEMFPAWQGSALIGGLTASGIVRVSVNGENAEEVERIPLGARIREVAQGPDGAVYVLTDQNDGNIWKLSLLDEDLTQK